MPAPAQPVTYVSDGHPVEARLYRADPSPAPGVLLCPGRVRDIDGLAFLGTALQEAGMTVLATRYRSDDMSTDDADCLDALDVLATDGAVDASRIGLVGHSRGAIAGLRVAAASTRVRSLAAVQPVADLDSYVRATRSYAPDRYEQLVAGFGAAPDEDPERYRRLSPLTYADRLRVPVLLLMGEGDLYSPAHHGRLLRSALQDAGNDRVDLRVLSELGHFFERTYHGYAFDDIAEAVVGWMRRTL